MSTIGPGASTPSTVQAPRSASSALQAQIKAVHLGGRRILQDIDLSLAAGRWTAIVGPNGAGKSTLLRTVGGLQACEGAVAWHGRPLAQWKPRERGRAVAWLGQTETGADDLRAHDVVMLGRLPHQPWLAAPSAADVDAVRQAMQATQCWDWRERLLGQLSGGERQRVLLARALAVQAGVLLMDEPLAHLDPPHQADWLALVRRQRDQGRAVVSVLHELNMALQADDLVVMAAGRVIHHGPATEAGAHEALRRVFDQRVRLVAVDAEWLALPCDAPPVASPAAPGEGTP